MTMTLTDALAGWHRQQVLEHATAQEFAEAFLASPDADDLEDDPTQEQIVAACAALYAEMTTTYYVVAADNRPDLRAAADLINRRLGDAGDTGNLRAVQQEIAECSPCVRDGLRIESEQVAA